MKNFVRNTTEEVNQCPEGFLAEALVVGTSNAIEASEARGQQQLVNSAVLPTDWNGGKKEDLEKAGVKFGEICKDDEMFQEVSLPPGWKKQPTDHSMWSELLDDKGRVRASIFYKAAFYDRSAHINLKTRFTVSAYAHEDKVVVLDDHQEIYAISCMKDRESARLACYEWLEEKYPDFESCVAYWD